MDLNSVVVELVCHAIKCDFLNRNYRFFCTRPDLEITVGHRTLTNSESIFSGVTFLPSGTMTNVEL